MLHLFVFLAFSSWFSMAAMAQEADLPIIETEYWGSIGQGEMKQNIKKFILKNKAEQEVHVITYGATVTAIITPNKEGKFEDVVLGFDNIDEYDRIKNRQYYFGATIGRVANRIRNGTFSVNNRRYVVTKNVQDTHSLHGGTNGWSFKVWDAKIKEGGVMMTLNSPDGDEGYPGEVKATVSFKLNDKGELHIEMKATSSSATPINLTNHSYFNLAGHETNADELYKHVIIMNADRWTITDRDSIPIGEIRSVENTIMDLRNLTSFDIVNKIPCGGYDSNFCLPEPYDAQKISFVAKVWHPPSGRYLEVHSNQPGVQFYTANCLPKRNEDGIAGKDGAQYFRHAAFCLETQNYPDAVNHENFPNSIFKPEKPYNHIVVYKFGVDK